MKVKPNVATRFHRLFTPLKSDTRKRQTTMKSTARQQ